MPPKLTVSIGQKTDQGTKSINQDCHGAYLPDEPQLTSKGIAVALADGISSSKVSHIASESAIKTFLEDYYCTSETWSVRTSAERVLNAINAWLYAQTRKGPSRYDSDSGYICTLSALVFKATSAYLFHIGDSRIYRLRGKTLEQLTTDHRVVVSSEESHLSRALGYEEHLEIDHRSFPLQVDDIFVLATDGVYEWLDAKTMIDILSSVDQDLDAAAQTLIDMAQARGSDDNLTLQLVRIDQLPDHDALSPLPDWSDLPPAPPLEPRMLFEGYKILRQLHGSSRSHIYLAEDQESGERVVIKTPSVDMREDPGYLERFVLEEWIARRLNSAYVLKPSPTVRQRNYIYVVTEYIEGQTLAQWMTDNPAPDLETIRSIIEQVARGLMAFHRLEMLHQDLRPNNIMIDVHGTAKIIDFGATRVSGLVEASASRNPPDILGTLQYTAPEYFLGETPTPRADLFSLAVIAYQMLSGKLPYGTQVSKVRTRAALKKLKYQSVLDDSKAIPAWLDAPLAKALHPDPWQRYEELSEFLHDLRQPNPVLLNQRPTPLIERDPLLFWKGLSALLFGVVILLLALHH
ncbi:MAG TPA: bifunctional protein-serine/threonine kinase/phosphatase [Rhodocyclaceae bacterium]|nr:bifunctional protein-serine/threonine kinase/phosphatase [Rhodocyclaceae bacterium]